MKAKRAEKELVEVESREGTLRPFFSEASAGSTEQLLREAILSEEIGRAAHIFERLDSDMLDNPPNNAIGI